MIHFLFMLTMAAGAERWHPSTFERVTLPGRPGDAVLLVKNKKGDKVGYSAQYYSGGRKMRERVLPFGTYQELHDRLIEKIIAPNRTRDFEACPNAVVVSEGQMVARAQAIVPHDRRVNTLCFNSRASRDEFGRWYRDARSIFQF